MAALLPSPSCKMFHVKHLDANWQEFHVKHLDGGTDPRAVQHAALNEHIQRALRTAGILLTPAQADKILRHAEMMLAENERRNLTRIVSPPEVAVLHVADSLLALPALVAAPPGPFADIGSDAEALSEERLFCFWSSWMYSQTLARIPRT